VPGNKDDAFIDNGGTAQINTSMGFDALCGSLSLGSGSGTSGRVEMTGRNLSVTTAGGLSGILTVGGSGTGTFTQSGGTNTVSSHLYLGRYSGGNGTYTLSNGTLTIGGTLYVGYDGTGTFTYSGGTLNAPTIELRGSNSQFNVDTNWTYTGNLTLYNGTVDGTGYGLTLNGGGSGRLEAGRLTANTLTLGGATAGTFTYVGGTLDPGTLTVQSNGTLTLGGNLTYTGTLNVSGGTVSDGGGGYALRLANGGSGTVSSGTGTLTTLTLGSAGTGSLSQSGGTLTVGTLELGSASGSQGTYTLSGTGALNVTTGWVGYGDGTGTFTQSGGTHTVETTLGIAYDSNSTGTYTLSGGTLTGAGTLKIGTDNGGGAGSGTFNLVGGTLNPNTIQVGAGGTFNVNTDWTYSGTLMVNNGTLNASGRTFALGPGGTLTLNGGTVRAGTFDTDTGFTWNSGTMEFSNSLTVATGEPFGATVNVTDNRALEVTNTLTVDDGGTVNLSGGTLTVGTLDLTDATGAVNWTGGTFNYDTLGVGAGTFSGAGRTLSVGAGDTVNLSGGTLKVGTIDHTGGGAFGFTGGTLSVNTFQGDLTNAGGTLAPGDSPGATMINGDYTQQAGGTLKIELGGLAQGTEYDFLKVTGALSLGGTLEVVLYGGFNPQYGNTFDLLDWGSLSGTFATVNLPSLGEGLVWDTSKLYTTGEIKAVPEAPTLWLFTLGGVVCWLIRRRGTGRK